jgi:hypothetical protein
MLFGAICGFMQRVKLPGRPLAALCSGPARAGLPVGHHGPGVQVIDARFRSKSYTKQPILRLNFVYLNSQTMFVFSFKRK